MEIVSSTGDRERSSPYPYARRLVAGVSPDKNDSDTLYIFKAHLIYKTTFDTTEEGDCVLRYMTDLGRQFFSPERFPDPSEALYYYSEIFPEMMDRGSIFNVRYWMDRYPNFERYEIIRFELDDHTPNLALTRARLQLKSLA